MKYKDFKTKRFTKFKHCLSRFIELTEGPSNAFPLIEHYFKVFDQRVEGRGELDTAKHFKALYGIAVRFAANQKFEPLPYCKSSKDGFPSILVPFKELLQGTKEERTAVLCILKCYTLLDTKNLEYDTNPITEPDTKEIPFSPNYGDYFRNKTVARAFNQRIIDCWSDVLEKNFPISQLDKRLDELKSANRLHVSFKNGPNGPALATINCDFVSVINDKDKTIDMISNLALAVGHEDLINYMFKVKQSGAKVIRNGIRPLLSSRLSLVQEPGGKNRIIAIADYFSQSALSGIHNWHFKWLKHRRGDGTFSHTEISITTNEWTMKGYTIYSLDLTRATDRCPAILIAEVITAMFGEEIGRYWYNLLTKRTFTDPDGNEIRYNKGQPMGMLSSWSSFTIWHHMILETCIQVAGISDPMNEPLYVIIGDDVAIRNKDVADVYVYILNLCGIDVSPLKGFSPETKSNKGNPLKVWDGNTLNTREIVSSSEIAKRVSVNGREITPVSPKLIFDAMERASDFPPLLLELETRGYNLKDSLSCLASICYKPKEALLLATFPLFKLPYTGVKMNEGETDLDFVPLYCRDIVWFQGDIPTKNVTKSLSLVMNKLTSQAENELWESLISSREWGETNKSVISKQWTVESELLFTNVYKPIVDQQFKVAQGYRVMVFNFKDDTFQLRKTYPSLVRKEEILLEEESPFRAFRDDTSSLRSTLNLKKYMNNITKSHNQLSKARFENVFVRDVIREVRVLCEQQADNL